MATIQIKAFAKVNLYLKILSKRDDGYHNINTLMQTVSLFDEIHIEPFDGSIVIECGTPDVPLDQTNTCYAAAQQMAAIAGKTGVKIKLVKNIPSGAGLGGGSSDAAAVLNGLNILWNTKLPQNRLEEIAFKIGSDVPFFISGGRAVCKGRGEIIQKLPTEPTAWYVLIKPDEVISTKWAYEEYSKKASSAGFSCFGSPKGGMVCTKAAGSDQRYENDFEKVVLPKYESIKKAKDHLLSHGAKTAALSGSGSCVFGRFLTQDDANHVAQTAKQMFDKVFVVKDIDSSWQIVRHDL